jgi:Flp pilus assembly pilin Flp
MNALSRLHNDESGQGMTEYILIVVFVAIAVLIVLGIFKDQVKRLFRETNQELTNVNVAPAP